MNRKITLLLMATLLMLTALSGAVAAQDYKESVNATVYEYDSSGDQIGNESISVHRPYDVLGGVSFWDFDLQDANTTTFEDVTGSLNLTTDGDASNITTSNNSWTFNHNGAYGTVSNVSLSGGTVSVSSTFDFSNVSGDAAVVQFLDSGSNPVLQIGRISGAFTVADGSTLLSGSSISGEDTLGVSFDNGDATGYLNGAEDLSGVLSANLSNVTQIRVTEASNGNGLEISDLSIFSDTYGRGKFLLLSEGYRTGPLEPSDMQTPTRTLNGSDSVTFDVHHVEPNASIDFFVEEYDGNDFITASSFSDISLAGKYDVSLQLDDNESSEFRYTSLFHSSLNSTSADNVVSTDLFTDVLFVIPFVNIIVTASMVKSGLIVIGAVASIFALLLFLIPGSRVINRD